MLEKLKAIEERLTEVERQLSDRRCTPTGSGSPPSAASRRS